VQNATNTPTLAQAYALADEALAACEAAYRRADARTRSRSSRPKDRPPFFPLGAVRQWRTELRAGVGGQRIDDPSSWRFDALYRAACYEAAAADAYGDGVDPTRLLRQAAEVIADAAQRAEGAA